MTKLKLGDSFSDDGEPVTTTEEEALDIDDDASSDDQDDTETSTVVEEEEDDNAESQEDEGTSVEDEEAKLKELQGLRTTEEELGNDLSDLDYQIQIARERVVQKRRDRRERRELIQTIGNKTVDDDGVDISDIDEEQIQLFERIAKARGYIPKTELDAQKFEDTRQSAQEDFLKKHPEYLPENDTDDNLYNALKAELALYAAPQDHKMIPKLFERAHKAVSEQYPDRFSSKTKSSKQQIAASSRTRVASAASKSSTAPLSKSERQSSGNEVLTQERISILKNSGWTDEDIEELME